jgi:DNA-binding transcriptional regulator YhcF (GntR family)
MQCAGDTVLAAQLEERRRESLLSRVEGKAGGFNSISPGFGLPLPEQIAEVLADEIIERKVASGSKLPESALAERFGTSRAPIREALYLLDQAGLVERTPRRGTVVRRTAVVRWKSSTKCASPWKGWLWSAAVKHRRWWTPASHATSSRDHRGGKIFGDAEYQRRSDGRGLLLSGRVV